ncbi:ABC-type transport auxiliary lipoprotein family protein [Sphingomonas sp. BN140010]|uniref:ABC-type transport auxiliary lipoprotein family protein n=1 Tax=Sphingomonas arvum TaxID=2992113 RepID=A0ABT3JGS1_9SPHN|nr:ABC-type transport auxiliary lipoprotein family protein [Sphingomonas sp. BN140010]MCW3797981.1 ABC-type transport auxiliary lipoprotein family protein [Sphingomonas sp. BN140010]
MRAVRLVLPAAAALALTACFGGAKPPPTLLTLTPQAAPVAIQRTATPGQAVTILDPLVGKELRQVRVPVLEAPGQVTYIKGLQYVDTPDRLFQHLLAETVKRTTNRVVLDQGQTTLDSGVLVTGTLERFGYDTALGQVIVTYDATLSTQGGTQVQARRFEATAPADGTAATVGPALNQAANAVASQVASWIGS